MLAGDGAVAAESTEQPQAAAGRAEAASGSDDGAADGVTESDASRAEVAAAADEPPVPQAGSQGEPGDPAHATEATAETDVSSGQASAPADDPFAPPVAPAPPSGVAAGSAPPPPSSATSPPPPNEPIQGLSLVGGVIVGQVKDNPAPFVAALVAILVALGILRRRARG
jgi:hypothetical protein